MAHGGKMAELVGELLELHYDPAYLRSIDRNFVEYPRAEVVAMTGIAEEDFVAAARGLLAP
jgi:tRNA 2-selenouridine synthase